MGFFGAARIRFGWGRIAIFGGDDRPQGSEIRSDLVASYWMAEGFRVTCVHPGIPRGFGPGARGWTEGRGPTPGIIHGVISNPNGVVFFGEDLELLSLLVSVNLRLMPQSLSSVYLHLIFSTKNRDPWLEDPALRAEMHAYLGGVSKQLDCPPVIAGGVADHIHLLARMGRGITQSDWVKELKRVSSRWMKERSGASSFAWQRGFGVFSVSQSSLTEVERYIANQDEHHRKMTFQDEFRAFLRKHRVDWDERYLWD